MSLRASAWVSRSCQRGTVHNPDRNVGMGKDHTLYALVDGTVKFTKKKADKSYVSVIPFEN